MKNYKHVLFATDFAPETKMVAERAKQIAQLHQAKLSLIHVAEYLYSYSYMSAVISDTEIKQQLMSETKTQLTKLGQELGVTPADQYALVGTPKTEIIQKAKALQADLIIVGSHGRHGLSLLLGSTSNAILHHAPCDVLCVRVKEQ